MNMHSLFRTGVTLSALWVALISSGCPTCDCDQADATTANVTMTPFSGRFGYGLSGPFGFLGALTKNQLTDQAWSLEGNFAFPTGGYSVGTPVIVVAESYPEQVSVTIPVTVPGPDAIVTQVASIVPVTAAITASNEAKFTVRVTGTESILCPDAVRVTLKNDKDAWTLESGSKAPRLLITCPSGIGEATIQFNPSCPLSKLLVGLRYAPDQPFTRLEGFEATTENAGRWPVLGTCFCSGFAQVELRDAAVDPASGTLTIRWVDSYR